MKPTCLFLLTFLAIRLLAQDPFSNTPSHFLPPAGTNENASAPDVKYIISFARLEQMTDSARALLQLDRRHIEVIPLNAAGNAYAYLHDGLPHIGLDTLFLARIWRQSGSFWSVWGILAHELGHHYYHHLTKPMENLLQEAAADYVSGFVLGRLGAPEDCIPPIMQALASKKASRTHPGRTDRVFAMRQGWQAGHKDPR